MKKIRQIHFYLGVFFAPAIIFFSLSGAFQTFRWQEGNVAGSAQPLLSKMASIHKDQSLGGEKGPKPAGRPGLVQENQPRRDEGGEQNRTRRPSPLPLKIYVFIMSIGLITSTSTGVYMAFKYNRDRKIIWGLLISGTVLPLLLLFI